MERPAFFTAFLAFVNTHGFWLRLGWPRRWRWRRCWARGCTGFWPRRCGAMWSPALPEWVRIDTTAFAEPLVLLLRAALVYGAVLAAPLPAPPAQVNAVAGPLFSAAVIALLAWGLWRSAGVCGLLFRSAQDRLDLESNKTMVRFFERIFRALVAGAGCAGPCWNCSACRWPGCWRARGWPGWPSRWRRRARCPT